MTLKKRNLKIFFRILFWLIYLLSGYFLYSESLIFPVFIGIFAKLVYPLSIFWIQIRIKNREPWMPLTDSMSTSQLWFRIIPIFASFLTATIVLVNLLLKVTYLFF